MQLPLSLPLSPELLLGRSLSLDVIFVPYFPFQQAHKQILARCISFRPFRVFFLPKPGLNPPQQHCKRDRLQNVTTSDKRAWKRVSMVQFFSRLPPRSGKTTWKAEKSKRDKSPDLHTLEKHSLSGRKKRAHVKERMI